MPFRSNLKFAYDVADPPLASGADEPPSKEQRKLPQCPHCKIEMVWYQSRLKRQNGSQAIVHSFHCPNCAQVSQIEEPKAFALRVC